MEKKGKAEILGTHGAGLAHRHTSLWAPQLPHSLALSNLFSCLPQDTGFPRSCLGLNDCPEGGYKGSLGGGGSRKNSTQQIWALTALQTGAESLWSELCVLAGRAGSVLPWRPKAMAIIAL
jgi:hypothetical protein